MTGRKNDLPKISLEEFREIIERATELEAVQRESFTEAEVRAIASELGIDEAAVARALEERRAAGERLLLRQPLVPRSAAARVDAAIRDGLIGGAIGAGAALALLLGAAVGTVLGAPLWVEVGLYIGLLAVPPVFALFMRRDRSQVTFQQRNVGYWLGAGGMASLFLVGGWDPDVLEPVLGAAAATGGVGGLILWARSKLGRIRRGPRNPDRLDPAAAARESSDTDGEGAASRRAFLRWWRNERRLVEIRA